MKNTHSPILKLLLVFFGIALGLIGLELTLRTASWVILSAQRWSNPVSDPADRQEFRIVTLGESTTAQFWSGGREQSWPGQLERYLNEAGLGRRFKVINLAKGGTSTPFQLAEFLQQAERLRPHAVISMMGVNDSLPYEYLNAPGFASLRTVKLAEWIYHSLSMRKINKKGIFRSLAMQNISCEETSRIRQILERELRELATASPEAVWSARRRVEALAVAEGENDWYVQHWASMLFCDAGNRRLQQSTAGGARTKPVRDLGLIAFDLARLGIEKNPTYPDLATRIVYAATLLADAGKSIEAISIVHAAMAKGMQPDSTLLTLLPDIGGVSDAQLAAVLRERGFEIKTNRNNYWRTLINYRRLADAARKGGIVYLAMQYPTAKVEAVRNLFSGKPKLTYFSFSDSLYDNFPDRSVLPEYKDVIYISNENFNKFTGGAGYWKYFTDQFHLKRNGMCFGHTTVEGHSLIARNAARAIGDNWPDISRRTR